MWYEYMSREGLYVVEALRLIELALRDHRFGRWARWAVRMALDLISNNEF